jgi:hypothetical protein
MSRRRVSVLIPCYRQARYLPEAVGSALAQTSPDVEVVIVDDGSPDDTSRIAGELVARDPARVRVVSQENRGLAMARAAGLDAASGELVVFLDADDLLERDMVATCLAAFDAHPDADLVVGNAWSISADGATRRPFDQARAIAWPDVLEQNPFGAVMAVMARAGAIREAGGLAVDGLRACEDWDLWVRMLRCGMRMVPVVARLGSHREHRHSLSRDPVLMLDSKIRVLDFCLTDDTRLASSPRPPAPPIGDAGYARYRNAAVFHGIGLALSLGQADRVDDVLRRLVPGSLDPAYAARQLALGWIHGQEGLPLDQRGGRPEPPWTQIDAALRRVDLDRSLSALRRHVTDVVSPRRDLRWVWRGIRWRLRDAANALLGSSPAH